MLATKPSTILAAAELVSSVPIRQDRSMWALTLLNLGDVVAPAGPAEGQGLAASELHCKQEGTRARGEQQSASGYSSQRNRAWTRAQHHRTCPKGSAKPSATHTLGSARTAATFAPKVAPCSALPMLWFMPLYGGNVIRYTPHLQSGVRGVVAAVGPVDGVLRRGTGADLRVASGREKLGLRVKKLEGRHGAVKSGVLATDKATGAA